MLLFVLAYCFGDSALEMPHFLLLHLFSLTLRTDAEDAGEFNPRRQSGRRSCEQAPAIHSERLFGSFFSTLRSGDGVPGRARSRGGTGAPEHCLSVSEGSLVFLENCAVCSRCALHQEQSAKTKTFHTRPVLDDVCDTLTTTQGRIPPQ